MNFNHYVDYDMLSWNMAIGDGNTNRKRKRKLENNSFNILNKNLVERVKNEIIKKIKKPGDIIIIQEKKDYGCYIRFIFYDKELSNIIGIDKYETGRIDFRIIEENNSNTYCMLYSDFEFNFSGLSKSLQIDFKIINTKIY